MPVHQYIIVDLVNHTSMHMARLMPFLLLFCFQNQIVQLSGDNALLKIREKELVHQVMLTNMPVIQYCIMDIFNEFFAF